MCDVALDSSLNDELNLENYAKTMSNTRCIVES